LSKCSYTFCLTFYKDSLNIEIEGERKPQPSKPSTKEFLAMELVKLEGTEKQVCWATQIRQDAIDWLMRQKEIKASFFAEAYSEEDKQKKFERLSKRTSAKWWIDHRADVKNGTIWDYV